MYIELCPHININDFDEMRAHYKDYLRSKNFDDKWINHNLNSFDACRYEENYEAIYELMTSIGVILVED